MTRRIRNEIAQGEQRAWTAMALVTIYLRVTAFVLNGWRGRA